MRSPLYSTLLAAGIAALIGPPNAMQSALSEGTPELFCYSLPGTMLTLRGSTLDVLDLLQKRAIGHQELPWPNVVDIASDASGSRSLLVLGDEGGKVVVAELNPNRFGGVTDAALDFEKQRTILGTSSGGLAVLRGHQEVLIYDISEGRLVSAVATPKGMVPCDTRVFSKEKRLCVLFESIDVLAREQEAEIWRLSDDFKSWEHLRDIKPPVESSLRPQVVIAQADISLAVRAHVYAALRLVAVSAPSQTTRIEPTFSFPKSFDVSPGGRFLAVASPDRTLGSPFDSKGTAGGDIEIWDVELRKRIAHRPIAEDLRGASSVHEWSVAYDLKWLSSDRLATLDMRQGSLWLTTRSLPDLAVQEEVRVPMDSRPVFLVASADGSGIAVCAAEKISLFYRTSPLRFEHEVRRVSGGGIRGEYFAIDNKGRLAMVADDGFIWWNHGAGQDMSRESSLPQEVGEVRCVQWDREDSLRLWAETGRDTGSGRIVEWKYDCKSHKCVPVGQIPVEGSILFVVDSTGQFTAQCQESDSAAEILAWKSDGSVLWRRPLKKLGQLRIESDGASECAIQSPVDGLVRLSLSTGRKL